MAAALAVLAACWAGPSGAAPTPLDRCLAGHGLPRVARVVGPDGAPAFARVVREEGGVPRAVAPLAADDTPLAEVFARAAAVRGDGAPAWELDPDALATRLCAPVGITQAELDREERVIVAAGLNYAAHAEEAGGGDVFLFPKPVAPTGPYGAIVLPADGVLVDYEVELGLVLLDDVVLADPPTPDTLPARVAFFVANDVSDREPIIRRAVLTGPGTGFVEGKGRPTFLPTGPWMVHGSALLEALEACGAPGLGVRLEVDEGDGYHPRQAARTDRMILTPAALLARIAEVVDSAGPRTHMSVVREGRERFYPLAVDPERPRLPAGSIVLTGTPEGVALQAPSPLPILLRGLVRLRGPISQFLVDELARGRAGGPGGYLEPGDRVRAAIDGLGAQIVRVRAAEDSRPADPCAR